MDGVKDIGVMMSPPMVLGLLDEQYPKLETRRPVPNNHKGLI